MFPDSYSSNLRSLSLDHAVLLTGYGTYESWDGSTPYWEIKNSWYGWFCVFTCFLLTRSRCLQGAQHGATMEGTFTCCEEREPAGSTRLPRLPA
jgi:Papain family cysteine protease